MTCNYIVNHGGAVYFRDEARSKVITHIGMHDTELSEWGSDELARRLTLQSDCSCTYLHTYIDCHTRTDTEHKVNAAAYTFIYRTYDISISYLRTKIITTTVIIIPISSSTPTVATTAPATAPADEMLSVFAAATRVAFTTGNRKHQNNRNWLSLDVPCKLYTSY